MAKNAVMALPKLPSPRRLPSIHGQNARQYGQNARQYGQNARQYGQNARQYGQNVHQYGQNARQDGQNVHQYGQNARQYGQNARQDGQSIRRRPQPAQTKPQAKHGLNRKARLTLRPAEPPLAARAETIFRRKSHHPLAAAANIAPRIGRPAKKMMGESRAREFHSPSLARKRPEKATKRPRLAFLILKDREISTKLSPPRHRLN